MGNEVTAETGRRLAAHTFTAIQIDRCSAIMKRDPYLKLVQPFTEIDVEVPPEHVLAEWIEARLEAFTQVARVVKTFIDSGQEWHSKDGDLMYGPEGSAILRKLTRELRSEGFHSSLSRHDYMLAVLQAFYLEESGDFVVPTTSA